MPSQESPDLGGYPTRALRNHASELASIVVETITGIRTVKSYGRERRELGRWEVLCAT